MLQSRWGLTPMVAFEHHVAHTKTHTHTIDRHIYEDKNNIHLIESNVHRSNS